MTDQDLVAEIEKRLIENAPLADILRMMLLLGGRLDSGALRNWAKGQLDGFGPDDSIPEVREVGAPIFLNAVVGYNRITGQNISASTLPDFASKVMKDTIIFRQSIPELESMIDNAHRSDKEVVSLTIPNWEAIGAEMDKAQEFQTITAMYRQVHVTSLEAIFAEARNRCAELLGELRRTSKGNGALMSGRRADEVVAGVVVNGANNSIVVASGKRSSVKTASLPGERSWWDAWGKAATIITVVVGVVALVVWAVTSYTGALPPAP